MKKKCYICIVHGIYKPRTLKKKEKRIMAKPIKETPVLYDEDAYRFEMAAQNVVPLTEEERAERLEAYERLSKKVSFAL